MLKNHKFNDFMRTYGKVVYRNRNFRLESPTKLKPIRVFDKSSNISTCQNDDKFKTEQLTFMAHKIFINVTELLQAEKKSFIQENRLYSSEQEKCVLSSNQLR